ncbi:MAG: hypothetical protein ACT4O2_07465, partial [Beijerinckiaceae bacterium]
MYVPRPGWFFPAPRSHLCTGVTIPAAADARPGRDHEYAQSEITLLARPIHAKAELAYLSTKADLTPAANDPVWSIRAKAMPALLTAAEEWEAWLTGSIGD